MSVRLTSNQKQVLTGMVLGDAYLQKTGKRNARIRLEHSSKQKDYMVWKASHFPKLFQNVEKPTVLRRYNETFGKTYEYVRLQSSASPTIGEFRQKFYDEISGKKIIPADISRLMSKPISLAVWFLDDGYYYPRDKMAFIYLPNLSEEGFQLLLNALKHNFDLAPKLKKKKKGWCLSFSVVETRKLMNLIRPHVIDSMAYKLLDPVSTDRILTKKD